MKKKLLSILLCATMVATMAMAMGCGKEKSASSGDADKAKDIKVGFAIKTQDSPYFVNLVKAVEDLSKKEGWKCTVLDANGDTQKEAENMETFVAQGMDLIFLDSVEPDACVPSINAAAEADIPVINLDSGVGKSDQCTTVYSDNKQNGRLVGIAYADHLKKGGKEDTEIISILLSGAKGNVAGVERRTGLFAGIIEGRTGCTEDEAWKASLAFEDQLTASGKATNADAKLTVRGQGWGAWTREEGLTAAEDLITANKDVTCILGENDQMLLGGLDALTNAGIKGVDIVAGADGAKEAYDLIKTGGDNPYIATGENSPFKVTELGMKIAKEILVDGKDWKSYEDITMTEAVAVTKDNVDERYEFGF